MTNDIQSAITNTFGNQLRLRISGICIIDDTILLVKHHALNQEGILWAPPGGGMQFGETAHETLKREFLEETGLEIIVGEMLFVNEYLEAPLHAVELFFKVTITAGELKTGFDPELGTNQIITQVDFMPWQEIQKNNKAIYHSCLHDLNQLNELMSLKGFQQNIKR
jgi:8-oxo-dGTP diphosphatase